MTEAHSKWDLQRRTKKRGVSAQITEIKRLRRALPSGIMEYGISQAAQDSRNENGRANLLAALFSNYTQQRVPLFFSTLYILQTRVASLSLPHAVTAFHVTSPLSPSLSLKSVYSPVLLQSEFKSDVQISPVLE